MSKDAWSPEQYEKFKRERAQPFYDLIGLLEPKQDLSIVDLGCGTGELTAELHRKLQAKSTLGIDSSKEMLKKAAPHAGSGLRFSEGDIAKWGAGEQFDVIFSNAALQWCSHHEELFARLRQALRPGGQLAVQMPMNHDYPTHTLAAKMSRESPWKELLGEAYDKQSTMLSAEAYASLLFRLGFREQRVFLRVYGHVLESREGVIEWVKGTLLTHFESRLSAEDYSRFLASYRQRLFQELPDEKPFFYPFKRILLWGAL